MKKSVLLFTMIFITLSLHAQTEPTYTEMFDSIFYNINRDQATTGILYERVVPFANLVNFNSNTNFINSRVDTSGYHHFIQSYSELYRAAFLPSARLRWTFEEFEKQVKNNAVSNVVDIGILHYDFNIMDSVVGMQKLKVIDSVLMEDTTSTASLYLKKTAFVAAVKPGRILFEADGVPLENLAYDNK